MLTIPAYLPAPMHPRIHAATHLRSHAATRQGPCHASRAWRAWSAWSAWSVRHARHAWSAWSARSACNASDACIRAFMRVNQCTRSPVLKDRNPQVKPVHGLHVIVLVVLRESLAWCLSYFEGWTDCDGGTWIGGGFAATVGRQRFLTHV